MVPKLGYARTAEDWQPYQSLITRLYRDENRTLKEVQQLLESDYNFRATYVRSLQQALS